ncbi:MAG: phosphate ABC transporter ATP-binding protein PstB [Candidatus Firestonebacteria bacterium]
MDAITVNNLDLYYGHFHALKSVNMKVAEKIITSIIGPSGCGKSTLLRTFNRMNDLIEGTYITGEILINNKNIFDQNTDLDLLRRKVGMVFQRPNPFPLTIFENVAFGLRIHPDIGRKVKEKIPDIVKTSLQSVLLWDEVKNKLNTSALKLSLEQQQRLCIARLLPIKPEILLMDEPCSALDPIATSRVEELLIELKKNYTIVIVTHNMQQAARISDETGFMLLGELIEFSETKEIFTNPKNKQTENYITGRFG